MADEILAKMCLTLFGLDLPKQQKRIHRRYDYRRRLQCSNLDQRLWECVDNIVLMVIDPLSLSVVKKLNPISFSHCIFTYVEI
jgi:hypothetical protein